MDRQNQIKRRLSTPTAIAEIDGMLASAELSRTDLARNLCDRFAFFDGRGRAQTAGCLKALNELSQAGHIVLPEPRSRATRHAPRRLEAPVPSPQGMPDTVGAIQDLSVVIVDSDETMRIWNELMLREHPQGAGPLVGAQMRYLISSAHGWLGGFGFSAAAIRLHERDVWLGWDDTSRQTYLHRIVSMSRFLLRPRGCKNLASHVLGQVQRRLAADFEARYGYRPYLLESFVDTTRYDGGCYRAANWQRIGDTRGRGRQDRRHECAAGVKAIYVYPLVADYRERLGGREPERERVLAAGEGLDTLHWAQQEFGDAPLGDQRLSSRLVASVARQAEQPGVAFSTVAHGDSAAIKGYYRLIDKPANSAVSMASILAPHQARTRQRMANERHVLCVADGTTLDYNGLAECDGLGVIGSNQTGAESHGIKLHSTLAINDQGVPLGIVDVRTRLPQAETDGTDEPVERAPTQTADTTTRFKADQGKKTQDWIEGLHSCMALAEQLPDTRITCVMDREADFFELFDAHRHNPCVDVLVRARHNRVTYTTDAQGTRRKEKLFDRLQASAPQGTLSLEVKRQSTRSKRSKQKARAGRPARKATLTLHYQQFEFMPPAGHKDKAPLRLWAVLAREKNPPADAKRVQWCLLTSRIIKSAADAERCMTDYALRWRIEDWHRVMKSGCQIEELAHESVERLERSLAINLVIAWRIMVMTLLGREQTQLPTEILFSDIEIKVLSAWASAQRYTQPPTNLSEAVRLTAMLGGYIGRKQDPPPGHQVMWRGYEYLTSLCFGYELRRQAE